MLTNDEYADGEWIAENKSDVRALVKNKKVRAVTKIMQLLFYVRELDIRLKKTTFMTNDEHTKDPVYFLQLRDKLGSILNDEDNEELEQKLFFSVFVHSDSSSGITTNMHGQNDEVFTADDENYVSIATSYLATLVMDGGMTVDGNVVTTIKEVEQLIKPEFEQAAEACNDRVDSLFDLLRFVVGIKKKRKQRTAEVTGVTKTKKQKKNTTKKRSAHATDKSKKKKKKAKKTE